MNTKMLMLGILLLAGLSFAQPGSWNWMEYSVDRYGCNYWYNGDGWNEVGLHTIAIIYDDQCEEGCWDFEAMSGYRKGMSRGIWNDGPCMCEYSGCWFGGEGTSTTSFRSYMLQYNTNAALYRAEFMAGLRNYLSEDGDRGAILQSLSSAKMDYLNCIAYIAEEGPCYACETI